MFQDGRRSESRVAQLTALHPDIRCRKYTLWHTALVREVWARVVVEKSHPQFSTQKEAHSL